MDTERINQLLHDWHELSLAEFRAKHYNNLTDDWFNEQYPKHAVEKKKYIYLDDGGSGAFLIDKEDGTVYTIKGYGVKNRRIGHIDTITGATLQARRWR